MKRIIPLAFFLAVAGCVSIPKETVVLSGEMGTMIASAKEAHLALLDQYEADRRERIDDYLETVWIPRFIKTMAKDGDLWGKTCAIRNTTDSALGLQGFVESAAQQIAGRRKELTDALDITMADLRAGVRNHYAMLERANQAVTSNLRSVRANDEVTESLLRKNGVQPDQLTPLREASAKLDKLFK